MNLYTTGLPTFAGSVYLVAAVLLLIAVACAVAPAPFGWWGLTATGCTLALACRVWRGPAMVLQ